MLYDAHNHLQDSRLAAHLDDIVRECVGAGIDRMVVNGTSEQDWPRVLELASKHSSIIPSFGLHPWFTADASPDWRDKLIHFLDSAPSGVGEIGLDRWMKNHDLTKQENILRAQLEIAAERNLPVTIHCLKAWGKLEEVLRETKLPDCGFLLHSYGGPQEMIEGFVKLGAYFSISGYFAHERKQRQREAFKHVPIDRLLIETDAPDMLSPASLVRLQIANKEGESINHPANLSSIYEFTATFREMETSKFTAQIHKNFDRLFGGV